MATIEKRGPYQYRARVRIKGQRSVSKTFTSKKDAKAWANMVQSEMERNLYICRVDAEKTTISEALDRYIKEYIPRLAHPNREKNRAKRIKQYPINKLVMSGVYGKDIQDFIKDRQSEGASPNTIRLDLALISNLYRVAKSSWGMESIQNPVSYTIKPKLPQGRNRRLTLEEEKNLMDKASAKLAPTIQFALETAMRREEIASLTWEQIDLQKRVALLLATKNGTARKVPLSPKAVEILKKLHPENVTPITGSVFKMTGNAIAQAMSKVRKRANIEDLRFHDFRHEAVSRFFENTDLDVMEIREISGHKSMQMLARYSHLRTDRLADRLAGAKRGDIPLKKKTNR